MRTWLLAPWQSAASMVELARHAETLGFTGIMGADHGCVPRQMANRYPYAKDGRPPIDSSFAYPEVWTMLTAIAVATSRLKLSTAVYVLPLRHPIEVAKATANLALLSSNRLVLGVGVGWMPEEFSAYGVDFRTRGRRCDEMIEVMRKLWQGGYSDYHGEFFDFPPVALNPSPSAPVPIYIGGDSEAALRRAASRAQGWIGTGNSVDEALVILSRLRALRQDHHRLDEPFETIIALRRFAGPEDLLRLSEAGMTSLAFGFADHTLAFEEKCSQMARFASFVHEVFPASAR